MRQNNEAQKRKEIVRKDEKDANSKTTKENREQKKI